MLTPRKNPVEYLIILQVPIFCIFFIVTLYVLTPFNLWTKAQREFIATEAIVTYLIQLTGYVYFRYEVLELHIRIWHSEYLKRGKDWHGDPKEDVKRLVQEEFFDTH